MNAAFLFFFPLIQREEKTKKKKRSESNLCSWGRETAALGSASLLCIQTAQCGHVNSAGLLVLIMRRSAPDSERKLLLIY